MTTPRDAIAGLIEKLTPPTGAYGLLMVSSDTLGLAATALDSLSARVKELEARQADDLAEFGLMEMRAIRAEQQRDEALKTLSPFAETEQDIGEGAPDDWDIWESPAAINIKVGHLRAARDLVRRLASGPEGGAAQHTGTTEGE